MKIFDFVPLVFFITHPVGFPTYAVPNGQRRIQNNYMTNSGYTVVTWEGHTVKWVAEDDYKQLNSRGEQYYYAAIG